MTEKPSYLGLLNAISLAESRAHRYLTAWIECGTAAADALRKVQQHNSEVTVHVVLT